MHKKLLLGVIISVLGGCINLGGDQSHANVTYVLADTTTLLISATTVKPHTLLIETTHANSFDDNQALTFSNAAHTRGRYKYAQWSELPSTRYSELLFNRLAKTHLYKTVANTGSDVIADRLLTTDLLAFYHDAATKPGFVHVVLRAELYDTKQHRLIARREFEQNTATISYDAAGAALAFNLATQAILNDISAWLQATDTP